MTRIKILLKGHYFCSIYGQLFPYTHFILMSFEDAAGLGHLHDELERCDIECDLCHTSRELPTPNKSVLATCTTKGGDEQHSCPLELSNRSMLCINNAQHDGLTCGMWLEPIRAVVRFSRCTSESVSRFFSSPFFSAVRSGRVSRR
jgi:hypothetical protein